MVTVIEGQVGEHISATAQRAIDCAKSCAEVEILFNDITFPVAATATVADVCAEYNRILAEHRAEHLASPECKDRQLEAEEKEIVREAYLAAALKHAPEKMTLRDPDGWALTRANNSNGYGGAVMSYLERWARVMEGMIAQGATVAGCAKNASHLADSEGITGFMYGAAVSILAAVWVHGEELRRWHNLDVQFGSEGEKANENGGVLNPAVLVVGEK